jgi:hypothetical protein
VKSALLAILLSVGAQAPGDVPREEIHAITITPAPMTGAWRGTWRTDGGPGDLIDADVTTGPRPHTLLGYFTFVTDGGARTSRRLGRVDKSGARFPLLGGGSIVLALDRNGRLVGQFEQLAHGTVGTSSWRGLLELARLRR